MYYQLEQLLMKFSIEVTHHQVQTGSTVYKYVSELWWNENHSLEFSDLDVCSFNEYAYHILCRNSPAGLYDYLTRYNNIIIIANCGQSVVFPCNLDTTIISTKLKPDTTSNN